MIRAARRAGVCARDCRAPIAGRIGRAEGMSRASTRGMCRGGGGGPEGVVSSDACARAAAAENSERVGNLPYERPRASARARAINCGRPRRPRPRKADALCFVAC